MRLIARSVFPVVRASFGIALLLCALAAGAASELRTFSLRLNESATLPNGARITFMLAHDARCPKEVACLHPGQAYALLRFEFSPQPQLITVAWPQELPFPGATSKVFGFQFCFRSLEPHATQARVVNPAEYKLEFTVETSSSETSTCKRGA
jgi:hypothetical protein